MEICRQITMTVTKVMVKYQALSPYGLKFCQLNDARLSTQFGFGDSSDRGAESCTIGHVRASVPAASYIGVQVMQGFWIQLGFVDLEHDGNPEGPGIVEPVKHRQVKPAPTPA